MHLAGKTDEAQADLARLAIIRKQREEAARKKEEERKGELLKTSSGTSLRHILLHFFSHDLGLGFQLSIVKITCSVSPLNK